MRSGAATSLLVAVLVASASHAATEAPIERGRYLTAAAGCVTCHTDTADGAPRFAGGRALATPFGTFYTPNITPDRQTGIGSWTDAQFLRALREGIGPDGRHYFPAFPFTSYTGMTDEDVIAIRNYLFSLAPVGRTNRKHDLPWFLSARIAAWGWQTLHFKPARFTPDAARSAEWNRGAYLVRHLGHCGECHSPRTALGAVRGDRELAGNPSGPENKKVPSIRSDEKTDVADWTQEELETFLDSGMLPDGDFAGAGMGEVITENTSQLTPADRHAIANYLKTLAPMH
jgi:mono/diheme cytochrome c family protein